MGRCGAPADLVLRTHLCRAMSRRIGLIGGMGWPSTRDYYEHLNRSVGQRRGGLASADLVIRSLDFADVIAAANGKAGSVEAMLLQAAQDVRAAGASVLGVCSNTGHLFSNSLRRWPEMEFVAADTALALHLAAREVREVWLLGVRRTLVHPMFHEALQLAGIRSRVPTEATMRLLDEAIFTELEREVVGPSTLAALSAVEFELKSQGARDVVLACTELPLAIATRPLPFTLWDTVPIHCDALLRAAQ
jgi:aspartate racemase